MIPTMIVFGLLAGRWWQVALVAGTVLWPTSLLVTGFTRSAQVLLGAALLAAVNTAIGVGVHRAVLRAVRHSRPEAGR